MHFSVKLFKITAANGYFRTNIFPHFSWFMLCSATETTLPNTDSASSESEVSESSQLSISQSTTSTFSEMECNQSRQSLENLAQVCDREVPQRF